MATPHTVDTGSAPRAPYPCCRICGLDTGECDGAHEHTLALPPDPEGRNDDRAGWAEEAVRTLADATGLCIEGDGWFIAIADLLADLRHFADRHDIAWDAVTECANAHYTEETWPFLLENCICGEHVDCPDGWHRRDQLPCSCTPDCALPPDDNGEA